MNQCNDFRTRLLEEEKSPLTVEKYLRDIRRFLDWLGPRPLSREQTLAWKQQLAASYAPASVNSMLSALNRWLEHIGRSDCRVRFLRRQRRAFLPPETELTRAEYDRLLRAAPPALGLLMQAICSTGIRVSEHRFLTVEAARAGRAEVRLKGRCRTVFLPKALCRALLAHAKQHGIAAGPVFLSRSGAPLDRSRIWAQMKKLCAAARVRREKVFPHNLRHLFARVYYTREKDIVRLADILGHASVDTTRIYTMESGEVHRRQLEKLGLCGIT